MAPTTRLHDMQTSYRKIMKSLFTVDTNGLCLACFNECQESSLSECESSINFCRMLARYLNIDLKNILGGAKVKGQLEVRLLLCLDCSELAAQFMTIYRWYELYQMKLNFCAETLCSIMKSAERIPSRVRRFRQRFNEKQQAKTKNMKVGVIDNEKAAECMRKEIISKCRLKTFVDLPRVVMDSSLNTENRLVPYNPLQDQEVALIMALLGCIVSFWLVLSLSFYNPDELIANYKVKQQQEKENVFISQIKRKTARMHQTQKRVRSPVEEIVSLEACSLPKCSKVLKQGEIRQSPQKLANVEDRKNKHSIVATALQTMKKSISEIKSAASKQRKNVKMITEKEDVKGVTTLQHPSSSLIETEDPATFRDNHTQRLPVNNGSPGTRCNFSPMRTCVVELAKVKNENLLGCSYVNTTSHFDCHLCFLQFDSRAKIEKHRAVDHSLTHYVQCSICNLMFRSFSDLQTHRNFSINGQCQISDSMKVYELLDIARPLFPYSELITGNKFCPVDNCFEVFESDDQLQVHIKSHGNFQCSLCHMNFSKAYDVAIREVNMTCCQSGAIVLASSPEAKLYKCTRCSFSHLQPEEFVSHFVHEHLQVSPFFEFCSICEKGLPSASAAKLHFATEHGNIKKDPDAPSELLDPEMSNNNNNKCWKCDRTFGSPTGLRVHMRNSRVHKPGQSRQLKLYHAF